MSVFEAIVLGLVQGATEFLPVSSSAHLALTPWLFGWKPQGLAFDVSLHIGTLAAVLWYFRDQWAALVRSTLSLVRKRRAETEEEKRVLFLALATVPGAVAGLLLEDYAETVFRSPKIIGVTLIVLGLLLWWVDHTVSRGRELGTMRWTDALAIGLAQCCALVPGVSRSGSTMTAGRALGFSRPSAAVFSFLMSMPITLAAVLLKTPDAIRAEGLSAALVAGVLASAVSGWLAISVLLKLVARRGYGIFAVYRVLLGVVVLYLAWTRG